jgi:hypothetical protein
MNGISVDNKDIYEYHQLMLKQHQKKKELSYYYKPQRSTCSGQLAIIYDLQFQLSNFMIGMI